MRRILLTLGILWASGFACAIDTVPMPEGEDKQDGDDTTSGYAAAPVSSVRRSAIFYAGEEPIFLVGSSQAAVDTGVIVVENLDRAEDEAAEVATTDDGSFNLVVHATYGETLRLALRLGDDLFEGFDLELKPASVATHFADANFEIDKAQEAESRAIQVAQEGDGMVKVSGAVDFVAPGITVVIANISQGYSIAAPVASNGSFEGLLRGVSGDTLRLFPTEPASSNAGVSTFDVEVP